MLSLAGRLDLLEEDLRASPPRTFVYADLPFGLFRYDPDEEWEMRRHLQLLATRLKGRGRAAVFVSLADLVWQAIDDSEGVEAIVELERDRGYADAQAQATRYLTSPLFRPLPPLLAERLAPLDPDRNVAFVVRTAFLAPGLYPVSKLLSEMMGLARVPAVLFYPGTMQGELNLQFMGLPEREALGSYRVKVYG